MSLSACLRKPWKGCWIKSPMRAEVAAIERTLERLRSDIAKLQKEKNGSRKSR